MTRLFRHVDDQDIGIRFSRQVDASHITNLGAIALLEGMTIKPNRAFGYQ
jgi:hypothetical protein